MEAGKCKPSTFKAFDVMREQAHIYRCTQGAHPRSQSKNKQMKSTENLKIEKLSLG